jgi:glycosyltransferase involved in cell wall biosynthesis
MMALLSEHRHRDPAKISVIMPCFNAEAYVKEAIGSVLGQSYQPVELIVVDDGSTDGSIRIVEELLASHPSKIKLLRQNHAGPYPARNLGLSHASGAFVAFLDADDWWREDCLEQLWNKLNACGADLAYCGWQNVGDYAGNTAPYVPPAYEEADTVAAFLKGCPWPIHAALIRRDVLDAVHGFSERCFSAMDYDLWLRILAHTQKIARVPEVLAFYRWHGTGQISANKWRQVLDALRVRQDFVQANPDKISHLSQAALYELVQGQILLEAYRAYWRRDLANAQKLLRAAFFRRAFAIKDLKYIVPALLPTNVLGGIIRLMDQISPKRPA